MKALYTLKNYCCLIKYRVQKYPGATVISLLITVLLAIALNNIINKVYPEFNPFGNLVHNIFRIPDAQYTFYSGPEGGIQ